MKRPKAQISQAQNGPSIKQPMSLSHLRDKNTKISKAIYVIFIALLVVRFLMKSFSV
jgi:hypothetical protein